MIRSGEHALWDAAVSEIMWAWFRRGPSSYEALAESLGRLSVSVEKASRIWADALGPLLAKLGDSVVQASGGSAEAKTTSRSSGAKPGSS